ncbi:NIPSNAP family protein [Sphingobium fluviale]|uniref:NIPSNAP family protein n=1 Tax=Sphingobium fluviale TaxID=2506423 RepID=A0A4Q1KEN1_9SPHN|nr:NIPSNAP family protein [Sphingobium fluviale]
MLHELRIYEAMPGRLGDLHRRFTDVTLSIWERLGVRPLGFWNCLVGPSSNSLYYLLEWTDLTERDEKWGKFVTDPEWITRRIESERNGALITKVQNILLTPTSFFVAPGSASLI